MPQKLAIFFFILCVLTNCTDSKKYPIESVNVDTDYYLSALNEVNTKLATDVSNTFLRNRKLLISKELRWPEDVSDDIDYLKREEGLNYELVQYAIDFYQAYHYYERLLDILIEWESINGKLVGSIRWRIIAYLGLGRINEAKYLLWDYIQSDPQNLNALLFIAENYLTLEDSTRAIYAYGKVADLQPKNEKLLDFYVPYLIRKGYSERAFNVLSQHDLEKAKPGQKFSIAQSLYETGDHEKAHWLLRNDFSTKAQFQRIDWFESEMEWDSATILINRVEEQDSSVTVLLRKARLFENRGWLTSSYNIYSLVLSKDSTNSIAAERAANVGRKIAYLRSLKEQQENRPVLEVSPKNGREDNE